MPRRYMLRLLACVPTGLLAGTLVGWLTSPETDVLPHVVETAVNGFFGGATVAGGGALVCALAHQRRRWGTDIPLPGSEDDDAAEYLAMAAIAVIVNGLHTGTRAGAAAGALLMVYSIWRGRLAEPATQEPVPQPATTDDETAPQAGIDNTPGG